jgi:glycosyltransferase involved in cell wall biosynthesis
VAFVEALYAGLPVVTTAMGGPLEIIDPDCGVLVPPGDVEALAASLLQLIRDDGLRKRLAANGPARAQKVSDPVRQLHKLLVALRETVQSAATA